MLLGLNVNYSNHHKRATALSNIAVAIIFVTTVLNVIITTFGVYENKTD